MNPDPIRIVIADDHAILKQGIANMLSEYGELAVVGEAVNGRHALTLVESLRPAVLVTDITMPGLSGYDLLEHIQKNTLPTRVLFLTMHDKPEFIMKAIDLGVAGYLTKDTLKDELVAAIRLIHEGQTYYGQSIMQTLMGEYKNRRAPAAENDLRAMLTRREFEILTLIASGLTTRKIAAQLFLSERTVSNHRLNILSKCNVSNTVELTRLYLKYSNGF